MDTINASADVMGYGWAEDLVNAGPVTEFWVDKYATINGNTKISGTKNPRTFEGVVGMAGAIGPVGAISVGYGPDGNCLLVPGAGAQFSINSGVATLTNWTSHDLGTGGCVEGSVTIKLTTAGPTFPKDRGSVSIDIAPLTTSGTGDIGVPTAQPLSGGKVQVVSL